MCCAVCVAVVLAGCSNKGGSADRDQDKGETSREVPAPKTPDFGSMPKDLCNREQLKRIPIDIINNYTFIMTDQDNLPGGQTLEDIIKYSRDIAEGIQSFAADPVNCSVKGSTVACDAALDTLNKANSGNYDMAVMKKNLNNLGGSVCGLIEQETDAWGSRYKTLYYVGRINGEWKYLFNLSQKQLDMADKMNKEGTSE